MFGYLTQFYQNAYQALSSLWPTYTTNALIGINTQASLTESGLTVTSSTLMQQGADAYQQYSLEASESVLLTSAIRSSEIGSETVTFSDAMTYLPPLLLASSHPVLSVGWLVAQQLLSINAQHVAAVNIPIQNIDHDIQLNPVDIKTKDITEQAGVQDVTEIYRARHLAGNNDACQSEVIFPDTGDGWALTLGGSGDDRAQSIAATSDGGVVVSATITNSFGISGSDLLLVRLSAAGELMWASRFGVHQYGSADIEQGYSLSVTADDEVLLVGSTGITTMMFAWFDSTGGLLWAKTVQGVGNSASDCAFTADHGFALTGLGNDGLLLRFNSQGELLWANAFGGMQPDMSNSLVVTGDDGFIITGNTESFGAGQADILVARFNATGGFLWAKVLGERNTDWGISVALTSYGGVVVAGNTFNFGTSYGDQCIFLARLTADGTTEWVKSLRSTPPSRVGRVKSVVVTVADQILLTGNTLLAGSTDILLASLTATGEIKWIKAIEGASPNTDEGMSLTMTADGQIGLAGYTLSSTGASYDLFVLKVKNTPTPPNLLGVLKISNIADKVTSANVTALVKQPFVRLNTTSLNLTVTNWTTATAYLNITPTLAPLAYTLNTSAFLPMSNAPLMYNWGYTLPAFSYSMIAAQPNIQVDMTNASWLSYDVTQRMLSGIPVLESTGAITIRVAPQNLFIAGLGIFSFENILLKICIIEKDTLLQAIGGPRATNSDGGYGLTIATADGSFLLTGTISIGTDAGDVLLAKFNPAGVLLWAKAFGGKDYDYGTRLVLRRCNEITL